MEYTDVPTLSAVVSPDASVIVVPETLEMWYVVPSAKVSEPEPM